MMPRSAADLQEDCAQSSKAMCSTNHPAHWVTFEDEGPVPPQCSVPRPRGLKLLLPTAQCWSSNGSSQVPTNTPLGAAPPGTSSGQGPPDASVSPTAADVELGLFWGDGGQRRDSWSSSSDSDSGLSPPRFFIRSKDGAEPPQDPLQYSYSYICHKLEQLRAEEGRGEGLALGPAVAPRPPSSFVPQGLFLSQRRPGWPLMLRIPEKKNRMSSRQWGPVYLRLLPGALLQLFYEEGLEKPFKEFQLQVQCALSGPALESYGEPGKIATLKVEQVWYTEKKRREARQLLKFGSTDYGALEDLRVSLEEELLRLGAPLLQHRPHEEQELFLQICDRVWMRQDSSGAVLESSAITQLHCLAFLNAPAECFLELGLLGRAPEEEDPLWMEILEYHLHRCVRQAEFAERQLLRFCPPDGCRVELLRFRTRGLACGDAPLRARGMLTLQGASVQLQVFLRLQPGFPTAGALPVCRRVEVRVPLPGECVLVPAGASLLRRRPLRARIHRNTCLGSALEAEAQSVTHASVGSVKYENVHRAVVWRIEQLPPKNTAVDVPQSCSCKLELASDQQIPADWQPLMRVECEVEEAAASSTRVQSVGIQSDIQPHKQLSSRALYHCQVEMEKQLMEADTQQQSSCATQ